MMKPSWPERTTACCASAFCLSVELSHRIRVQFPFISRLFRLQVCCHRGRWCDADRFTYLFILLHHCPHRTQGKPRARTRTTCVHFSVPGVYVMPHNAQARLLLLMMLGSWSTCESARVNETKTMEHRSPSCAVIACASQCRGVSIVLSHFVPLLCVPFIVPLHHPPSSLALLMG